MRNYVHRNLTILQLKLLKQLIYNYVKIIPWKYKELKIKYYVKNS